MATAARQLGEALDRSLDRLLVTSERILDLYGEGRIAKTMADDAVGGLAVLAHAEIEGFIERLFTGLLVGSVRPSNRRTVKPLVRARSYQHARSIIIGREAGGGDFASWLPYRKTKDHADRLFRSGRPFVDLAAATETAMHQLHHVRNAIAHSSVESLDRFRRHCVGGRNLPMEQRRPAGFLRGIHTGNATRLEYLLSECRVGLSDLARR